MKQGPTLLVILDGFGYNQDSTNNAIFHAKTHTIMDWFNQYPSSLLQASGPAVGLLPGMIGNSEVGHMTIGSGRILEQPATLITHALEKNIYAHEEIFKKQFKYIKESNKTLHFIGLLSDAGVHSLESHLLDLLKLAVSQGITNIVVHPFLDGRDVPPQSAALYLTRLETLLSTLGVGVIGTIHGRFYAMDRDNNWDRTKKSYTMLTELHPSEYSSWQQILEHYYKQAIYDEFIPPLSLSRDTHIKTGDAVIFFNFREDRARQLTHALVDESFTKFDRTLVPIEWFVAGIQYYPELHCSVLCSRPQINDSFADVLEQAHKSIFSIAETEKYAHITYFLNGGREILRAKETRVLIPSLGCITYKDCPEMSGKQITQQVIQSLETNPADVYIINYAHADMVGHSGDFAATTKAVEYLNGYLQKLYTSAVEKLNGTVYITADHGKAEDMFYSTAQQPRTAHTTNLVPFIMIRQDLKNKHYTLPLTQLANIAPFILEQLQLPVPKSMLKP
ncbi:2,3-bisphosphoglycerate-independent phosphoglycerate mutase [Candidatus Dependentiae bacterium]|nr:2,3-bisphosphoglycerate-independent phosphoglycerate mutase [Candidatus Dependentiae bacterium]